MRADASALRRHPDGRRLATLLATVRHLEGKSVDDTLELLDLLMATELVGSYSTVSGFLKTLPEVIEFGANVEGTPVLEAMKALPDMLAYRSRLPAPLIPGRLVDADVVNGPWKRLVFGHPVREDASVTIRDSLHMVDVIFGLVGGDLPEIVVSDTGSYSGLRTATPWPARSGMGRRVSSTTATSAVWRTNSARSAWSSTTPPFGRPSTSTQPSAN